MRASGEVAGEEAMVGGGAVIVRAAEERKGREGVLLWRITWLNGEGRRIVLTSHRF